MTVELFFIKHGHRVLSVYATLGLAPLAPLSKIASLDDPLHSRHATGRLLSVTEDLPYRQRDETQEPQADEYQFAELNLISALIPSAIVQEQIPQHPQGE
jgi:hypothetical protein